jgi:RimJ/RimL family protein N-acetyltransferase
MVLGMAILRLSAGVWGGAGMRVCLETERLVMRRFTPDNAELLVELDSDPEVMRYLSGGPATPREVIESEVLPRFLASYERGEDYGFWAAIEKTSGAFVGWFGLNPHDEVGTGEVSLGYRLRRAVWGQGYATEGARALIRKGFGELGARRVFATTYEYNMASRRVMEKLGMRHVRSFRLMANDVGHVGAFDGSDQEVWDGDEVEYAITREEWAAGVG